MLNLKLNLLRNRYFLMILRLMIAGGFLWWVMRDLKFSELSRLSWNAILISFIAAAFCVILQVSLTAVRWLMLLRGQGIHLSLYRVLSLTFQGSMFSLFMPGGAVGGDLLKAAFLTRETRDGRKIEGVTTIFLDRVIGMMGLFLLVLLAALFCRRQILAFGPEIRFLVLILLAVCVSGLLAGVVLLFQDLFFRLRWFAFLLKKADALLHGAPTRILNSVETCRRNRKILLPAFLMSFLLLHPLLIFAAFLVVLGITGKFPPPGASVLAFALGNTASVAPVTPGGLGTRDKVMEVLLQSFGTEPSVASLTPILYSMVLMLPAMIGIVFFLLDMRENHEVKGNNLSESADRKEL